MDEYKQFEEFEFKPWMGVLAGVVIFLVAGARQTDLSMVGRGTGMTLFFGSIFLSHRRRKRPGDGASVGELQAVVFAGFCALMTLGFIINWIYTRWFR